MPSSDLHISAATVVNAIRALVNAKADRTGRAALLGYLVLKSKEEPRGSAISVHALGQGSVEPELDRFFGVAPGSPLPYVNPFGTRQGRLEWLGREYERRGVYTWLLTGRTLDRFLDVQKADDHYLVRLPTDAPRYIVEKLGAKVPLDPAAAFLLRRERFPPTADRGGLIQRFREIFHLAPEEVSDLFEATPNFSVEFHSVGFTDAVDSLPADLHPPSPALSQATAAKAAEGLIGLAPSDIAHLVVSDSVSRRARRALARSVAIALVGPPGTGKSRLVTKLVEDTRNDPEAFGLSQPPQFDIYAAETDWTARHIVGGYFPQESGRLVFQEGYLLKARRGAIHP